MPRFQDKRVIVTGAAAALGRTLAQSFAREGADIAILDFQPAVETEALARAGGSAGASAMTGQAIDVTGGFIMR